MNEPTIDENFEIYVEFPSAAGRRQVAKKPEDAAKDSAKALDKSMGTVQYMARQFTAAMNALESVRPEQMELEFGIKFDTEFGAVISKVGVEANINVKLIWKEDEEKPVKDGQ